MRSFQIDKRFLLGEKLRSRTICPASAWLKRCVTDIWMGIREWCGDSAYERYVQAQEAISRSSSLLTREQFYVDQLDRKYSRPNRCC